MADANLVKKDLGPVSAYAIAVKHGYQGTEEEWAEELINAGNNAASAAESAKEAAETLEAVHETVAQETAAALQAVQTQQTTSVQGVKDAAEAAGTRQQELIEAKGAQTLEIIPEDYTELNNKVATLSEETVNLESDNAAVIPNGTDYDTLMTPGNFKVQTLSAGASMVNAPVPNAGRLTVMRTSQSDRLVQVYIANTGGGRIFWRLYDGAWSAWDEIAKASSVTALSDMLTAPSYYDSMLTSKAQKINLELSALGFGGGDAFVFITDIHEKPLYTPLTMERICQETNITKIINNGDVAKDKDTKAEILPLLNKYYNLYNFPGCDLYKVVGNHEFNNGGAAEEYADRQLSADELYRTIFGGNANNVTVDPAGTLAYYFDDPAAKMRYFVCAVNYKSTVNYESINWTIAELENVPADYDVVVFCHHGLNSAGEYTTYTSRLVGALDAYKAHTTYTNDYNNETYDYTQKSGEVICMCVGDEHTDLSRISDGGIPIIATTCASVDEELGGLDRVEGTTSESAYDVYVINKQTRTINVTRIGAGSDRIFAY